VAVALDATAFDSGMVQGDQRPRPPSAAVLRRSDRPIHDGMGAAQSRVEQVHASALSTSEDLDSATGACVLHVHRSASPVEGNPDTFWDVELHHAKIGWLIDNYGQG
jgi:hypothetical protein